MWNLPKLTHRQWIVMPTVILAAAATSSYNRLLSNSMPDLRGIWGLDADEGSMLLTLALAPQLLLAPITPWLSRKFGVRKTVLPSSLLLVGMASLIPFLHGYAVLLVAHAVVGALFGIFITLAVNDPVTHLYPDLFAEDPTQVRSMIMTEASARAFQDAFQASLVMALVVMLALLLMRPSKANVIFPIGI